MYKHDQRIVLTLDAGVPILYSLPFENVKKL